MKKTFNYFDYVISGGQTGVDIAALDWAIANSIPHGGWCPKGRRSDDGPIDLRYALNETDTDEYAPRTKKNVEESDGTLVLNLGKMDGGTLKTFKYAKGIGKAYFVVQMEGSAIRPQLLAWLEMNKIRHLNIAGPRERKSPGIYDCTIEWLDANFL